MKNSVKKTFPTSSYEKIQPFLRPLNMHDVDVFYDCAKKVKQNMNKVAYSKLNYNIVLQNVIKQICDSHPDHKKYYGHAFVGYVQSVFYQLRHLKNIQELPLFKEYHVDVKKNFLSTLEKYRKRNLPKPKPDLYQSSRRAAQMQHIQLPLIDVLSQSSHVASHLPENNGVLGEELNSHYTQDPEGYIDSLDTMSELEASRLEAMRRIDNMKEMGAKITEQMVEKICDETYIDPSSQEIEKIWNIYRN